MLYLTADEKTSAKRTREIASVSRLPLWPSQETPFFKGKLPEEIPSRLSVLLSCVTEENLADVLFHPVESVVDSRCHKEAIAAFFAKVASIPKSFHKMGVLLTSPVVYNVNIAEIFVEALSKRLSLSKTRIMGIHFALHEAIVNGLIHGNLQIGSEYRQSALVLAEYGRLLDERINNPAYADKSLKILASWNRKKLEIRIRDEGVGYQMPASGGQNATLASCGRGKSGRGLLIIAGIADSCTLDDFGREITLTFSLKEKEHTADTSPYESFAASAEENRKRENAARHPDLGVSKVLIVEDNQSNLIMVRRLLNVIGINRIETARDGVEGLQKVVSFQPDLVILDITMPRMDGYEVLHHLKSADETKDIPVLIQTASDTREARDKTFSAGATDFITKPINPLEFFSRVRVHLENKLLISKLEMQLGQINEELALAQRMQKDLLPKEEMLRGVRETYKIDIAFYFEPSSKLGGDFWELIPIDDSKLAFYICDFSGHGVSASLNTFRLDALTNQMSPVLFERPEVCLAFLNEQLCRLLPRGQFATFLLGMLDLKKNKMVFSGAGCPGPLYLSPGGDKMLLTAFGMPLGIKKDIVYERKEVPFERGTKFLLYSDALIETPNLEGKQMKEGEFWDKTFPHFSAGSAEQAIKGITEGFFSSVRRPISDDLTIVFFERKG